jgi:anti-sigma regulatory factor (Ser/Thr protein kinase)
VGTEVVAPTRFTVTVPAHAGLVGTLRVFASSVARHYGLSDDVVEDVKLAVSEACTDAVQTGSNGDIQLEMDQHGDVLSCRITSASSTPRRPQPAAADLPEDVDPAALDRMHLVRALFADAERSEGEGMIVVAFSTASRTAD